ncbi:hypothetical protein, partial [Streptomyces sp. NRRL WC-3618]|uniref:hypothetical protein n=1 Tax=Streptomyces sp. NRRL WC-3618 TaxID=1519490 RepID=UPI000A6A6F25
GDTRALGLHSLNPRHKNGPPTPSADRHETSRLEDEQKLRQANTKPTILLFDAARTGMAWIRPHPVWAQRLAMLLPDTTPFIGAAVMTPTLDDPDVGISLGVRANLTDHEHAAVNELARRLGLTGL